MSIRRTEGALPQGIEISILCSGPAFLKSLKFNVFCCNIVVTEA